GVQGVERAAVDDQHATVLVTFFLPILSPDQAFLLKPASYTLTGGQRLFPQVTHAALAPAPPPSAPTQVLLTLDGEGDFSIYTLTVSGPNIDPFFASTRLRFRLGCQDRFDCRTAPPPTAPLPALPVSIDYLAKDYSSFRQGLLDFLSTRYPDWSERSEADLGILLLELFSYTADTLSYMQDRVAGEAFLSTATQRRSIAGHLQLIGYQMDEGASAHTWLQFQVNQVHQVPVTFRVSNQPRSLSEPVLVFEPLAPSTLDPEQNAMQLYDYGNAGCCLPPSALGAALVGSLPSLQAGDSLLFDSGQGHRDIVRLITQPSIAPAALPGSPPAATLTTVTWGPLTPLTASYCVGPTIVRGNLVLATHGETLPTPDTFTAPPAGPQRLRFDLSQSPLAHIDPATLALLGSAPASAPASYTQVAPRSISTLSVLVGDAATPWQQLPTLLDSSPTDHAYRVEIDDTGLATLVFGQGGSGTAGDEFGLRPLADAPIRATYRVGGGALGNVAPGTLVLPHPQPNDDLDWFLSVSNPLPASGGRDLESSDHARRSAPFAFQQPLVAVTAQDYETAAQAYTDEQGNQPIERATASFEWTGSWLTVTLVVEVHGTETLSPALRASLLTFLDGRRLAGYDLEILGPTYVPIDLQVSFCTQPGYSPSSVQQQLQSALGNTAFFYPDNFSFGQNLYVSQLFAAIVGVPGVLTAHITRLALLHAIHPDQDTAANLAQGFLAIGPGQILRLDNDPNFPENGVLTLHPMGATA
ncbi:MAG TPA: baseplate J/gp47 family protein, partial [Acidobacteriaceae bacterium]